MKAMNVLCDQILTLKSALKTACQMNEYWKHVTSVFGASLLAQLIPIIGSLAITRIFAPGEFGEFSTWLALVSFISVVATLRLETALPIVEYGQARIEAVFIIFSTTVMATIFLFTCLFLFKYFLDVRSFLPGKLISLFLIVPSALFLASNQLWQTWAAVDGIYGKLNRMRLFQAAATVLIQIIAGLKYPTALSLIVSFTLANCISFFLAAKMMPSIVHRPSFHFSNFKYFFIRYKKFPMYALPADSINSAVAQLPLLVVFHRFGGEVAGYLALTMRVLGAPAGLVGKAVLDVFKYYAVKSIREVGNCRDLYIKTFVTLLLSAIIMVTCTVFFAKDIFQVAFGKGWVESGRMAIWLLPMFALGLIASPLSYMSYLVEKQHVDMLWQISLMFVVSAALYSFSSYQLTLIGYGVGYALMYVGYIFMSYRFSCDGRK